MEWFFPLHSMPGVSTKNFRPLDQLEDPALAPYIIQRKFQNIQRKISKVSILNFLAFEPIYKWFYAIDLHSWSPDASFDTHIAMSRHDRCGMPDASFMSKIAKNIKFDAHTIQHMSHIDMAIWVSKVALGPRECRPMLLNNVWMGLMAQNVKILIFEIFLCIFWNFLCKI